MGKEILLYTGIYDWTAEEVISKIHECMGEELSMRQNCPGGSVFAGWGMAAKIKEHGNITMKVDGMAASMGFALCLYAKEVECLSVSRFMAHRADMRVENPEQQSFLDSINKDMKAQMKAKLNGDAFLEVTGSTIDAMFEGERKDFWLTAKQAKKIGLVTKINKLEPEQAKAFNDAMYKVAASVGTKIPELKNENPKSINMTVAELKQNHPSVYAEVMALGVAQEKDRVESCLVFVELDPKAVKEAIESGKPLTQKQMAEFTMKSVSAEMLKVVEAQNPKAITTTAEPVTTEAGKAALAKAKKEEDQLAEILAYAGIDKPTSKEKMVFTSVTVD